MNSDPRLQGQERYLSGVTLFSASYRRYSEAWDHDHCEFCRVKFTEAGSGIADSVHQGYCAADGYRWICLKCFEDFKADFHWSVEG